MQNQHKPTNFGPHPLHVAICTQINGKKPMKSALSVCSYTLCTVVTKYLGAGEDPFHPRTPQNRHSPWGLMGGANQRVKVH